MLDEEVVGRSGLSRGIYPKAEVLNRFVARFVDIIVVIAAAKLLPPVGWLAGLAYILFSDGFSDGQSIGKRLTGLQTVNIETRQVSGFRESIVRNTPLGVAYLFFFVPYIGWLLAVAVLTIEGLLVIGNEQGLRVGDEFARTQILERGLLETRD